MAVTVSQYNHTARRFADGSNAPGDSYKVMLCTAATFDATNTTLAGITKTEVASGSGYTSGGATLTGVAVTTVSTNDAMLDADDAVWLASGGSITASYAILYNSTDANSPPVLFIDFGGSQSVASGGEFRVVWNASNGIMTWTTT